MGRFNTVKMTILKILSISLQVFEDINKFILKCICKNKGTEIVKTILEKKNKVEGIRLQSSKLIISNTKLCCWWEHKHRDQRNKRENYKMDLYKYAQMSFDKDAKAIQSREGSSFNKWGWSNWISNR